jgi:hypothetical protein
VLFPAVAFAQTIYPSPEFGTYSFTQFGPPDEDVEACRIVRTDIDPNEVYEEQPAGPNAEIRWTVDVPITPGVDAVIQGQCRDRSGNWAPLSAAKVTIDFTPPGPSWFGL